MPTYVALGSSFASGPGIDPLLDARCGRSGSNYAHLVAERLGYDLVDVTCGGATGTTSRPGRRRCCSVARCHRRSKRSDPTPSS